MKLAIMQPYFLPYLGYFQLIGAVDRFVVYDDVNYIKGGWINRNRILVGGRSHIFTLPPRGASPNKKIHEVGVNDLGPWRKKFLRTLEQQYSKSPFFAETYALVEDVCSFESRNLAEFVCHSLERVSSHLGIGTPFVPTSRVYDNAHLSGQERVIDICSRTQASVYVNPIGGMELYDRAAFAARGVALRFLEPKPIRYAQRAPEFVPNLSIVDVMMSNSLEDIAQLLREYTLI